MTSLETRQGESTPDTLVRLTPEGDVAVRALFAQKSERIPALGDYYSQRFGPGHLIDQLRPEELAAASELVQPQGTPIIAEAQVMPVIKEGVSYQGGW